MNTRINFTGVLSLILLCLLRTANAQIVAADSAATSQPAPADTVQNKPDSIAVQFYLPQTVLLQTEDHDLAKWAQQLPHLWVSRSPLYGQPQYVQISGAPGWLSEIRWHGITLGDPVFGQVDLNTMPLFSVAQFGLSEPANSASVMGEFSIDLLGEKIKSPRPFSQIFYRNGDYGLSDVDVLFHRGFGKQVQFQAGANFYKTDGMFTNSAADIFKLRSEIQMPVTNKFWLKYQLLTNRTEAGYPGAIFAGYRAQFSRLHRRVRRQDHSVELVSTSPSRWQQRLQLQLHQDQRDYTDWRLPWHSQTTQSWTSLAGQLTHSSPIAITTLGLQAETVQAKAIDGKKFGELPLSFSISHQRQLFAASRLTLASLLVYFAKNWQDFTTEIDWSQRLSPQLRFAATVFYRQAVPPLGWRKGNVLPFDNQPWAVLFTGTDSTFITQNAPTKSVLLAGMHNRLSWQPLARMQLYADLLAQQVQHSSYPQTIFSNTTAFKTMPAYKSVSLFLSGELKISALFAFTGRYQFADLSDCRSPELAEIPSHWGWLQWHAQHDFFQHNLRAQLFLVGEYLSSRNSYGLSAAGTEYRIEPLAAAFIVHLKLLFEIGDAQIFLQWQDLNNQPYAYRSKQPIPGWQFQYGVKWQLWD